MIARRAPLPCALALCLAGCGRYADFTLPPLHGLPPAGAMLEMRREPVLSRGKFQDVLNPSVLRVGDRYLNLYSAFDGHTWHSALAESEDGMAWLDRGVFLSPDPNTWEGSYIAANGSGLIVGGRLWYWYQAGPKGHPSIGLAERDASGNWRKESRPVLEPGPYGSWDEDGVADPYVLPLGDWLYLYYLGQDRARPTRQRIGLARSRDGRRWEKLRTNPVLQAGEVGSFDEAAVGEPAVWTSAGRYYMLYTGSAFSGDRSLGLAVSPDGVLWNKSQLDVQGGQSWNRKVLCDPTVLSSEGSVRVWLGGGDTASPDENLHGQIGYGILRLAPRP